MRESTIQSFTGLLFSVFLSVHLLNHALAAVSEEKFNEFLALVRPFYQNLVVEILFIFVIPAVHIYYGLKTRLRREDNNNNQVERGSTGAQRAPFLTRFFRYTGLVLSVIYFGHVFSARILPALALSTPVQFSYVAYTLQETPLNLFFLPYYLLFSLFALYHMVYGIFKALVQLRVLRAFQPYRLTIVVATVVLFIPVMLGVLGMAGWWYEAKSWQKIPELKELKGMMLRVLSMKFERRRQVEL